MNRLFLMLFVVCGLKGLCLGDEPIVIAHRGASGYLPEHTLESKAMAHAMNADFIEQDIVLTKDSIPVVLHDIHVDTVSDVAIRFPDRKRQDGRYYAIDFTLDELRQLSLTERFNIQNGKPVFPNRFPKDRSRFEIATLEEELQLIQGLNLARNRKAGIYPEIKQPAWHRKQGFDPSQVVIGLLRNYGYTTKSDDCWLQCFEYDEVKRVRTELNWEGRLVLLLGSFNKGTETTDEPDLRTDAGMKDIAKVVDGIGPAISLIIDGKSPTERQLTSLTRRAHALGLKVHPYTLRIDELPKTVSSVEDLMQLLFSEAKVDGLFTDFPDVAVDWLSKNR